ncbi:MAG: DoxX family protein [Ilumatobacter sp.]
MSTNRPSPTKRTIGRVAQVGAASWILNVWFNRFDRDTGYRGGEATNMKEEFEEYGFSEPQMYAVGAAKVSLALALLIGLVAPKIVRPAAIGLGSFMVGAVGMHVKVGDPVQRSAPALSVLSLSAIAALFADRS